MLILDFQGRRSATQVRFYSSVRLTYSNKYILNSKPSLKQVLCI